MFHHSDVNFKQAVRAAQDEQIRLKDIEVNELKSVRMDLERDLRDTRTIAEKVKICWIVFFKNTYGLINWPKFLKNRCQGKANTSVCFFIDTLPKQLGGREGLDIMSYC